MTDVKYRYWKRDKRIDDRLFSSLHMLPILLMICISVIFFAVRMDDKRTTTVPGLVPTGTVGKIKAGDVISQRILCTQNNLDSLQVIIGTYGKANRSTLHAVLLEEKAGSSIQTDGSIIQAWDVDASKLRDSVYYSLQLDKRLDDSAGKVYRLTFTSDAKKKNAVTLYKSEDPDAVQTPDGSDSGASAQSESRQSADGQVPVGLSVNGQEIANACLCINFRYIEPLASVVNRYFIRFLMVAFAGMVIWLIATVWMTAKQKASDEQKTSDKRKASDKGILSFFVIWGFLTVLYAVSNPVFNVPDEPNHFLRCYEISEGHLLSDYSRELNAGGRELPFDITELHENTLQPQSWYEYEEKKGKELNDDEDRHFVKFSNTALYSPLSYLPQVTGISAARLFSKNIYAMALFGRLANWLCITLLIYGTLKLLPYGKEFFMLLALMPMSLFEAFSLAPDGMVFALSSFLIAFVLDIRMNRKMLTFRHYAALYLMAVIMCSMKIVYLPFCLYYFLIPGRSFRHGNRSKLIHSAICVLLVGGISLGWMRLCSRFLTTPGTDSAAQLKWIIARPFTYLMLILRFLLNEGGEMVMEAAGRVLGMRDIPIPSTFILVYLIALAVLFWKAASGRSKRRLKVRTRVLTGGEKEPIDRTRALARGEKKTIVSTRVLAGGGKKSVVSVVEQTDNVTETLAGTKARRESVSLVSLVVCVLVFLLTFTALYLQWNAVHATIMEGFQGRYLIPLMFPGFLVLAQMRKHEKPAFNIWNQCCVLMVNFCCCTCVLFSKI